MSSRAANQRFGKPLPADHLRLVVPAEAAPPVAVAGPLRRQPASPPTEARPFGDWAWQGLGIGAATASAGFATYALIFSTGEVVPSGHFNLFARYDHIYQAPATRHGATRDVATAEAPEAPPPSRAEMAKTDAVDFTPTGSLAAASDQAQGDGRPNVAGRGRYSPESRPLPNFTLRDVFDGKALVESRSSLSVVKPGSLIDGAGEVLSIEKRGDHWVVLTANGVIAGPRR